MLPPLSLARPTTLNEALRLLADGARLHAGGSDLLGCLRDGILDAPTIVSLSEVDELRGIAASRDGGLRIGAMTTLAEIAGHPQIGARFTALTDAAEAVGSPQLRNQGTLAGNLCQKPRCWYYRGGFDCLRHGGDTCFAFDGENELHCIFGGEGCHYVHPSDTAPALAVLGATAAIVGPRGTRGVTVEELFVPPGTDVLRETVVGHDEILASISIPPTPSGFRSSYRKVRARGAWDFALVAVALGLELEGRTVRTARVVLGGVAPVPWRSIAAEQALAGAALDPSAIARAAEAAVVGAEPLEHNGYKVPLLAGLVTEQLEGLSRLA
jgi:xanthine dehydrogenase YagS FAD-binding subunit